MALKRSPRHDFVGGKSKELRAMGQVGTMNEELLDNASALLKAMGNRRRLHILSLLSEGERRVGELESLVGLSQSALSQHLARLRKDGLVVTRRQAQTIFYSLAGDDVREILRALDKLGRAKPTSLSASRLFETSRQTALSR